MDRTIALVILGLVAIAVVIGGIILQLDDKSLSEALVALGAGSVGAVAGIVAPRGATTAD